LLNSIKNTEQKLVFAVVQAHSVLDIILIVSRQSYVMSFSRNGCLQATCKESRTK